ncbi:hypothetical protein BDW71DRAFT_208962 [Aspergillus fruticulosus]
MPGEPEIDPFYEPYCARPKPRRLLSTRSSPPSQPKSPEPESREKRRIIYDSDDCVWYLTMNSCVFLPIGSEPTEACRAACKTLLRGEWGGNSPTGTVFDENKIQCTVRMLETGPENAIIHLIGELVVPSINNSVELLRILAASLDEPWDGLIPLEEGVPPLERHADLREEKRYYLPRPQPDYSVGFSSLAFTKPTMKMHFPFMVSEVKLKTASLHVADHQSMHSMALCLRGIIYLFRVVKREQELDCMILGFSITHNSSDVRIYGYYPVISRPEITYHTHNISSFQLGSKTRWNSYKYIMAVYHKWVPLHLERICSAIEQLPERIRSAEPAQPQAAGILSDSGLLRDLAGSAEWAPSRRGSDAVSSSHHRSVDIASPALKTGNGSNRSASDRIPSQEQVP